MAPEADRQRRLSLASDSADLTAALLAILVVRRISARIEERGTAAPPHAPQWLPPAAAQAGPRGWSPHAPERVGD